MKILTILVALFAFASAISTSGNIKSPQRQAVCNAPAKLDAKTNVFANHTLHSHSAWRNMILNAVKNITDATLKAQALRTADQGTFAWM